MEVSKIQGYDLKDKVARETADKNTQDIIELTERVDKIPNNDKWIEEIATKNTEQDKTIKTHGTDIEVLKGNVQQTYNVEGTVPQNTENAIKLFAYTNNETPSISTNQLIRECINHFQDGDTENFDIMTFNIENEGFVPYRNGLNHIEKTSKLQNLMLSAKVDVVCLQETLNSPYYPTNELYGNEIHKYNFFHSAMDNLLPEMNYGLTTVSYRMILNKIGKPFDRQPPNSDEADNFTVCTIKSNGRTIRVYNLHMSAGQYEAFWKEQCAQIEQHIQSYCDSTDNIIIAGDFNFDVVTNFASYFPNLYEWGYQLAYTGSDPTHPETNARVDNIIVSSNITVLSCELLNNQDLSDHIPVRATLHF